MKNVLMSLSLLVSAMSFADADAPIVVGHQAHPVRVNSVQAKLVGTGFPSTQVSVIATFGNSCEVPHSDELVSMTQYSKNFNDLVISLGTISDRACPAVYAPVTVTIDVGMFTKPNDGSFSKVIVNGKVAVK